MIFNRTVLGFIKKELAQSMRDRRMKVLIFGLPLIQLTIFGFALSSEVRNIKLAVLHSPRDAAARVIETRAYASGWFKPADCGGDCVAALRSGKVEASLEIPPGGFVRALERGEPLQLLVDSSNSVRARQVESYCRNIIAEAAAQAGYSATPPAVRLDIRVLYNPSLDSAVFMVPGVMGMILCIITIILTSMSLARERETGTLETLISAPIDNWEILAGKTLPYILLGMLDVPIIAGAGIAIFGVPLRGHIIQLLGAGLVFVFAATAIGVLISTFAANQQQAMMGGFSFLFPAMLLSGIMFPVENIPDAARWIAYLNPLMYFARMLRDIMLKGGDWNFFFLNVAELAALGSALALLAVTRLKQRLN